MNPFNVPMQGPFQYFMDIAKHVKEVRQNPGRIANLLLDQGTIDQDTFQKIKGMNPSQIGAYLMQHGLLNRQQAQELYKSVPHINSML